ncbi:unnamed protein product [Phytophthora lilii]|uniref:Unnamed protein product n=1 Tax=Phytophthora lilii TaxID=2077276 RepID=A0A9W6TRN3_9STRA|nr:unnamed protein product [Phytophthora lilii]
MRFTQYISQLDEQNVLHMQVGHARLKHERQESSCDLLRALRRTASSHRNFCCSSHYSTAQMAAQTTFSNEIDCFLDMIEMPSTPVSVAPNLFDESDNSSMMAFTWSLLPSPKSKIDDYADDTSSSAGSTSEYKISNRRQTERIRQRRYRQRLRSERENLLDEAEYLSQQVNHLKQATALRHPSDLSEAESCWLTAAANQREERQRSEIENRRLQEAVTMQAAYIELLRCLVPSDSLRTA